jgi:NNP family nitrate/nitrite transporter-like MFS transporter
MAAVAFPLVMGTFGVGNGAVFQLVGLRYRERIGVLTGLVGAAGGLGGFFLPTILGATRDAFGSYGPGIGAIAAVAAFGLCGTRVVRGTWIAPAGARA